jgi:hypothetical protein
MHDSFEPRALALVRGSIAIYSVFGLLVYLLVLSLSAYTSGTSVSTSTTYVPIDLSLNNIVSYASFLILKSLFLII